MVVHDAATFPGIVLTCRVIGILKIEQKSKGKTERNDRLFAVLRDSHSEQALKDVRDLSQPIQQELEKFFKATDELEDKKLSIIAGRGPRQPCRPSRIPPNLSKRTANSAYAAFSVLLHRCPALGALAMRCLGRNDEAPCSSPAARMLCMEATTP